MPPIATLRDDFTDNATATAWTATASASATVAETGGQARFTLPSSTAGTHIARYTSRTTYDLTAGSFYINIDTMVATGVAATAFFQLYFGSGANTLQWIQLSGTLYARSIVASVATDQYSAAWNASTYKYLRISASGGNVLWQSSTNGTSWTTRATVAGGSLFAVTALTVDFGATCGNVASPGSFRLEDVNLILPALATTWRWQQALWPLTERNRNTTIAIDAAGTAQGYLVTADEVDANGDPSGNIRYWSGPADGGRLLTEQSSQAAAEAMAVDLPLDGRFDLAAQIEARCFRLYDRSIDGAAYTIREFYPRRLVQADDIEAESIRALHLASHIITADHIATVDLDATARITAGAGNVSLDDDGISVLAGTATYFDYLSGRAYTITHTDGDVLRLYGNKTAGQRNIYFDGVQGSSTDDIEIGMRALPLAGTTKNARVGLTAGNSAYEATLAVRATNTGSLVSITADQFAIGAAVNVGSATGAALGEVRASAGFFANSATAQMQMRDIGSVVNTGLAQLVNATGNEYGIVFILDSGARVAMFVLQGGGGTTQELLDPSTVYSNASGTASMTNIYWSVGNNRYELQNNTGVTRSYKVFFFKN